jgi:glutamyl-tRNA synthetase
MQKRFVPGATDRLCEDLQWAGLQWDEGPGVGGPNGPYWQSERNELYQKHAQDLLDEGVAYRCFCTPQTAGAGTAAFVTSGCYQDCSHISKSEAAERAESGSDKFTVRLKQPENVHKRTYPDLIYGNIKRLKRSPAASATGEDEASLDAADTILLKSDGTPTYHFANVVDDHLMKITHVIRGTEWMASTPLHYDLYTAFGWQPPIFAHVGLLLDKDKAKLSKRNADLALDVKGLRDDHGVLPETLCNFLTLQGWSNPKKNDVMSMDELAQNFDLKFTRGNTMVLMDKLWFLQKNHVQRRCEEARKGSKIALADLVDKVSEAAARFYPEAHSKHVSNTSFAKFCKNILLADDKSYQTADQFVQRNWYFFKYDDSLITPPPPPLSETTTASSDPSSIADADVHNLAIHILRDIDAARPYIVSAFEKPTASTSKAEAALARPSTDLERASARIHAYLNEAVWRRVLSDSGVSAVKLSEVKVPFTDQPIDNVKFVEAVVEGESQRAEVSKAYKEWQKASMRFLRERLAAGTPGPGVGALMAVLGYEECCRRVGIEAVGEKGW